MDIKHYYIEQGQGEPLILLHGNGESSGYFAHQMDAFSKYYRVIALDTRGHGRTPRGTAPFTIRQFAADLYAFLRGLNLKQASLLGFSDGANIAMIFAMEHPECVHKLILNGGNLGPGGVKGSVQLPITVGYRLASLFAGKSREARANAELLGLMVNDPNIEAAELSTIVSPTLVLAGTRDMIKSGHTRLIADSIPNAQLRFIEGTHFIASKNPEEFNRAVLDFLLH